jgi:hypothetical protein
MSKKPWTRLRGVSVYFMLAPEMHSFTQTCRQSKLLNHSKRLWYLMSKKTDMKGVALDACGDASRQNHAHRSLKGGSAPGRPYSVTRRRKDDHPPTDVLSWEPISSPWTIKL